VKERFMSTFDPGPDDDLEPETARRRFLGFLAGSPLLANATGLGALAALIGSEHADVLAQSYDVLRAQAGKVGDVITKPEQALNVMDFEPACRKALPAAHYGYLATGVDDDATLRRNHEDFEKIRIKVNRLVDARKIDTSMTLLGTKYASPIFLSPVSSQGAFHAEAEIAVARAAGAKGHHMILSTVGNSSLADVDKAHGSPVWLQLYPTDDFNVTTQLVRKAEQAGTPCLMLTVDRQGGRNTETLFRLRRQDDRNCMACHAGGFANEVARKPMFAGIDVKSVKNLYGTGMTWEFLKRLRGITKMKLFLKGIMSPEDARRALDAGADGLLVSNHGGRAEESLQSTIGALPAIVKVVGGRIPVLVDGGVRRGTDVYKALALGATGVGIGRPYCWGLAAFGEPGVAAVLSILTREFETIMRQVGTVNLKQITPAAVNSDLNYPGMSTLFK
jgi:isopentenyl diphosphate isomerase/L-lactate dehydrogenase-like FMN-dependent dehydrogenase